MSTLNITMAMMDENNVKYVESDIIRWIGFMWNSYSIQEDSAGLSAPPAKIVDAKSRIEKTANTGGVPDEYRPTTDERKAQLWKASISIPVRAVNVHGNMYNIAGVEHCSIASDDAMKPKRPSDTDITSICYLDDQRKKRMLSLIKTKR
jgi:hypothetical protein